jgi:hypothetical protein
VISDFQFDQSEITKPDTINLNENLMDPSGFLKCDLNPIQYNIPKPNNASVGASMGASVVRPE